MEADVRPSTAADTLTTSQIYHSLSSYPFHTDPDFQAGLASILATHQIPSSEHDRFQQQDTILQAQCFYFARQFNLPPIDPAAYHSWLEQRPESQLSPPPPQVPDPPNFSSQTPPPGQSTEEPQYPSHFATLVDLITTGAPIPGIEEIPATVLDPGSSVPDQARRRKKPWEGNYNTDGDEVVPVQGHEVAAGVPDATADDDEGRSNGQGVAFTDPALQTPTASRNFDKDITTKIPMLQPLPSVLTGQIPATESERYVAANTDNGVVERNIPGQEDALG